MTIKISVSGLREMDAALGELSKATARNVLKRAGTKALQPMADTAGRLAPVETGQLGASVKVSAKVKNAAGSAEFASVLRAGGSRSEARAALVSARAAAGQDSFVMLYMGPDKKGSHGVFQEFGTVNHPPRPFMRPAFDQHKQGVIGDVGKQLRAEIDKAAERARRRALRAAKK